MSKDAYPRTNTRTLKFIRILFLLALGSAVLVSGALAADVRDQAGTVGWDSRVPGGGYHGSADGACRAQFAYATQHFPGTYRGIEPTSDPQWVNCKWNGLVNQIGVKLVCAANYLLAGNQGCMSDAERNAEILPQRSAPNSCNPGTLAGTPNPTAGNPVELVFGRKIQVAEDYATADGLLAVTRTYVSRLGKATSLPWRLLPGGGLGWSFDLAGPYLVFSADFDTDPSLTVYLPDGTEYSFVRDAITGVFEDPDVATRDPQQSGRFTVEIVGTEPLDWSTINTASSQWNLQDHQDRKNYIVTTQNVPGHSNYTSGFVTKTTFESGYYWDASYGADAELTSITDVFGRELNFYWLVGFGGTATNRPVLIDSIELPDGTFLKYTYTALSPIYPSRPQFDDVISKVEHLASLSGTDPSNIIDSTTYHYDDDAYAQLLTGITDHRNVRYATFEYDDAARVIVTEHNGGADRYEFSYARPNASTNVTTVTNPLGKDTIYTFARSNEYWLLSSTDGQASPNCVATTQTYAYLGKLPSSITDEEGRVTTYSRNAQGLPTEIVQASGTSDARTTRQTWRADQKLNTLEIPGLSTAFAYDGNGRLIGVTQTDTTTHAAPYATNGQTRVWGYTYTSEGKVATVDGPLSGPGDTVTYAYDTGGYLESVTDALGHVTTILATDSNGRPLEVEDPNGIITEIAYSAAGDVLTFAVDPGGAGMLTTFTYDAIGNLTGMTRADGSEFTYSYDDANRLTGVQDASGNEIAYTYDAMGNRTGQEISNANANLVYQQRATFDELGRLLASIDGYDETWTYAYDKVGNVVSVEDPRSGVQTQAFNGLHQLIQQVDQSSNTIDITPAPNGFTTIYEDPRGIETAFVRNGWGEVIQETSPDTGAVIYERNALGLITKKTDARSIVADYTYDNAGRLTAVSYPAAPGEDVAFTYDSTAGGNLGVGRLTGFTDPVGNASISYNSLGLIASESLSLLGTTFTTSYYYDAAGNLFYVEYPSGRRISYWRGGNGEITTVGSRRVPSEPIIDLAYYFDWQPFDVGLQHATFANGLELWQDFNLNYRPEGSGLYDGPTALVSRHIGYGDGINLTGIWDGVNPAQSQAYWYSPTNQLQNADGAWGELTFYQDGSRNRTWRILDDGTTLTEDQFHYPSASNRLSSVWRNGVSLRTFTHDAAGNIATDVQSGVTTAYTYNHADRLASFTRGGTQRGEYTYNARGQLVVRAVTNSTNNGTTAYFYDLEGRPLAEYDAATAELKREYVWLGDRPMAIIDPDGSGGEEIYYVHADHLNRPLALTDATKAIVGEYTWLPYGGTFAYSGTVETDLRFPGQMFQQESGLFYNWFRQYDPTTGRYTQPDPLGLVDGPSRYAYVNNDPLQVTDPSGLQMSVPIGGGFIGDLLTPDPTDALWPKWVGWGLAFCGAVLFDHLVFNESAPPPEGFPYPGDFEDPESIPEGWEWRGRPPAGGHNQGNWHNPESGGSLNDDRNHPPGKDPHWGYKDSQGNHWENFGSGWAPAPR